MIREPRGQRYDELKKLVGVNRVGLWALPKRILLTGIPSGIVMLFVFLGVRG